MRKSFSDSLRVKAAPIWEKIFTHPFLTEMGEGRLPLDKFKFFVRQDYPFLIEFARCLGMAVAKAEDRETMLNFASLLSSSLTVEMEMLESLGNKLGIPPEDLRRSPPAPNNIAYTRHILYIAFSGSVGEMMAAMLPCMWTYQEIGEKLNGLSGLKKYPIYSEWCSTYISQEYVNVVKKYRDLADHSAIESGLSIRKKMGEHFLLSSRYEYLFWDMVYRKEIWPF